MKTAKPSPRASAGQPTGPPARKAPADAPLYHGSDRKLTALLPRSSRVLDGARRTFATTSFETAVIFIPKWTDSDLEYGSVAGVRYVMEQYPGAFGLLRASGFVHEVSPANFETDARLGLSNEYVSTKKEVVQKVTPVRDALRTLRRTDLVFVPFEEKERWLKGLLRRLRRRAQAEARRDKGG